MFGGSEFASVAYGLASAASWGMGDFSGGYSSRRTPVLMVLILSQLTGLAVLVLLGAFTGEAAPSTRDIIIGAIAGIVGDIGLASLYRAMAIGQMSIAAPLTSVLSAIIPAIYGALTQGLPSAAALLGFGIALVGIWLISRPATGEIRPEGLGLALLAGAGFGGFLILVSEISHDSLYWPLSISRMASISAMLIIATSTRRFVRPQNRVLPLIMFCGVMDVGGNVFFALAEQTGRVDIAAVLSSLYPVVTVTLALIILKERLTRLQGVGVILAFAAVLLISL